MVMIISAKQGSMISHGFHQGKNIKEKNSLNIQ